MYIDQKDFMLLPQSSHHRQRESANKCGKGMKLKILYPYQIFCRLGLVHQLEIYLQRVFPPSLEHAKEPESTLNQNKHWPKPLRGCIRL